MDKEERVEGTAYRLGVPAYDRTMHVAGVPRPYWDVKRNEVAFTGFKQQRFWKKDGAPFMYRASRQQDFYDGMLATIHGEADIKWSDYASGTFVFSSDPTDNPAKCAVGHLLAEMLKKHPGARMLWRDANQRSKWGGIIAPDPKQQELDVAVITGLHPSPTPDCWESVRRWREWAILRCPCILVGSGTDPIDLSMKWFGIDPDAALFAVSETKRSKTYG